MKNNIFFKLSLLLMLVLTLTACSGSGNTITTVNETDPAVAGEPEAKMPLQTQLIVGTFQLEETDLAVDAEQAQDLIPLWRGLKSLLNSESSSQVEIDALITQISETMTADQMVYITEMEISNNSYMAAIQTYLPEELQNNALLMNDEERQARRETAIAENGGEMPARPGGGIPGAGGMQGGGGGDAAAMREAMQNGENNGFSGNRNQNPMNVYLIDALIEFLQSK